MDKYPDELRADFQEYYGLDTDEIGASISRDRAAALAVQLPLGSRCLGAENPNARWTVHEWLLARIEHDLALLVWSKTKDAEKGRNAPKMLTPEPPKPRYTEADMDYVASFFDAVSYRKGG